MFKKTATYIYSLQQGKITAQGKLLLQDTVLVAEVTAGCPQKLKERRVFLFEQIIIFSEMTEKRRGDFSNANYVFKNSVKVSNCLAVVSEGRKEGNVLFNDSLNTFYLWLYSAIACPVKLGGGHKVISQHVITKTYLI